MNKNKILLLVTISLVIVLIIFNYFTSKPDYYVVDSLQNRLSDEYVLLHQIVSNEERLGKELHNVDNDLYNKNEGWILRNKDFYCSNRIVDNIEKISSDLNIKVFKGNLPNDYHSDMGLFKRHLIDLNEICISVDVLDSGEEVLTAGLFVDYNHKIWKKN